MPAAYFLMLLAATLLAGQDASAQENSSSLPGGARIIELQPEPSGEEPKVIIGPRLSTTFTFDAALLRDASGRDTLELEKRETFALIDAGQTTLRLIPSETAKTGERLRLTVRFKDGAVPRSATFILVVHPAQAERMVEVYRDTRSSEFYQRESRQARAVAEQCLSTLERERAERAGPGGLAGLIFAGKLDLEGVKTQGLTRAITRAPGNPLITTEVFSYRSARLVTLEVRLETPTGAQPWTTGGAVLVDRKGIELKVLPLGPSMPLASDSRRQRIVVEAEALPNEAQGTYTLKLWEAGTDRTVILSGVSFP
ncbi:DUF2381 family protein [Pyxidicoccus sp. 3LG]